MARGTALSSKAVEMDGSLPPTTVSSGRHVPPRMSSRLKHAGSTPHRNDDQIDEGTKVVHATDTYVHKPEGAADPEGVAESPGIPAVQPALQSVHNTRSASRSSQQAPSTLSSRKRSYGARDIDNTTTQAGDEMAAAIDESPREPKRSRPSPNASHQPRRRRSLASLLTPRSRFIEGSMRDRASQRPPREFTDKSATTPFAADSHGPDTSPPVNGNALEARGAGITPLPHSDAGDEPRSSVFRFGRALANAFNPAVMLGSWSRPRSVSPTKEADDRKAKAEKAYADLKRAGFIGTRRTSGNSSTHDSGIDIGSGRTSDERPAGHQDSAASASPSVSSAPLTPELTGSRRPRPAFPALIKAKSHFSLRALRRDSPGTTTAHGDGFRVKKKASKKELTRQHKLTKRISNLESQLERARRELAESMSRPAVPAIPPAWSPQDAGFVASADEGDDSNDDTGRPGSDDGATPTEGTVSFASTPGGRRFVPALPSLPSERLLLAPSRALPTPHPSGTTPMKLQQVIQGTDSIGLHSPSAAADPVKRPSVQPQPQPQPSNLPRLRSRTLRQVPSDTDHGHLPPSERDTAAAAASVSPDDASPSSETEPQGPDDVVPGISTADLRSLYRTSAHAKRLRAQGPAARRLVRRTTRSRSPAEAKDPSAAEAEERPARSSGRVRRKSSVSPKAGRVRRAARGKAVTATPGMGDRRGGIVPPLPEGVAVVKGRATQATDAQESWEGWGDDVF